MGGGGGTTSVDTFFSGNSLFGNGPVDCVMSSWTGTECNQNTGFIKESRYPIIYAANGATPCPTDVTREIIPCQVDCQVSWQNVGDICEPNSATIRQVRTIIYDAKNGGTGCPPLARATGCAVNCQVSWTNATGAICDPSTGKIPQFGTVIHGPKNGGTGCPPLTQLGNCPVNCVLGWRDTTINNCSNLGTKVIYQWTIQEPKNGGAPCMWDPINPGEMLPMKTVPCNTCVVTDWSRTGPCDVLTGRQDTFRTVIYGSENPCPSLTGSTGCVVHCKMSDWQNSTGTDCNPWTGIQPQFRTVIYDAKNGGKPCENLTQDKNCPVYCKLTDWFFTNCDKSTGKGARRKNIVYRGRNGGIETDCPDINSPQMFQTNVDCQVDCEVNSWQNATGSVCDEYGSQNQYRTVKFPARNGGTGCPPLTGSTGCNINCIVGDWGPTGPCNPQTGLKSIYRAVKQIPANKGIACPDLVQSTGCKVDCKVSDWIDFSNNNDGTTTQKRDIIVTPKNGGEPCPDLNRIVTHCKVSDWKSVTGTCDLSGNEEQTRTIIRNPSNGGSACPPLSQYTGCQVNCEVSDWGPLTACDENGFQYQRKTIIKTPKNGGTPCPPATDLSRTVGKNCTANCNVITTPTGHIPFGGVECVMSDWIPTYDPYSGKKTETRFPIVIPGDESNNCPTDTYRQSNYTVDCKVSNWSDWGECDKRTASKVRNRTVIYGAKNGGAACPVLTESTGCLVNCELEWFNLDIPPYVDTCTNGQKPWYQTIIYNGKNGGTPCPTPPPGNFWVAEELRPC
jgi:hypothetical protein